MRFDDNDNVSENIGSQRGMGGMGGGGGGGGLGGNLIGLLLGFVISRFGIVGVLVLVVIGVAFFGLSGLGSLVTGGGAPGGPQQVATGGRPATTGQSAAEICRSDPATRFACQVYSSTERQWAQLMGGQFRPPHLIFYDRRGRSGCGAADRAMGPFYCPADQGIYLDTSFFQELAQRFGAPGDFAQAYVIAHEMGHHIQYLNGTNDRIRGAQQGVSESQGNALQVRMELQADCYAGVWARTEQARLEQGDLEEGQRAAAAIGDDTLQQSAGRRPVPESFTHGTSAQRQAALRQGFEGGRPESCASFMQGL